MVAFIGYFSYPIYLWHLDVQPLSRLFGLEMVDGLPPGLRWLRNSLVYVIAASAVGVFFGVLLEKPSLVLRNRLFPARTGSSPVEQQTLDAPQQIKVLENSDIPNSTLKAATEREGLTE